MVDEQIAEIDKLNAVINAAERDMLKLRKVMLPAPNLSASVLHAAHCSRPAHCALSTP